MIKSMNIEDSYSENKQTCQPMENISHMHWFRYINPVRVLT